MYTCYSLLTDICYMSVLLFVSNLLRNKIKWLQNHYIPASIIAGFIGLILGPQVLHVINWSDQASSYPYLLICIMFAGIFLGKKQKINAKYIFKNVGDTFFINAASEILCFGVPLLLGGIIIVLFFKNVFPSITLLLPAGFAGGHGYAAAIGGALNELLQREDAITIGQTFATIGLLVGLLGGLACINWAAKRGATRFVKSVSLLPEECRTGIFPKEKIESSGDVTIHPMSMDNMTWHFSLIMVATGIGYLLQQICNKYVPELGIPLMCLTMLAGMVVQLILNKTKWKDTIDKKNIDHISGGLTDYLVAFGVSTIKITVVIEFWQPVIIMSLIGTIVPLIIIFFIGRKLFHNFWFERSIFIFGYLTGIVAVGVTLLRSCDPMMKSETLDDFGCSYTLQAIIEVFLVALIPTFVVRFGPILCGAVLTILSIVLLFICGKLYGTYNSKMNELRVGESEKM